MMQILKGEIIVEYLQDEKKEQLWKLVEPIVVVLSNGNPLTAPSGFVTDFASVPKVFWSVIAPIGKYNLAAVIHDYFYTEHPYGDMPSNRKYADREFLRWLNFTTPKHTTRNKIMFFAVRLFGKKRWDIYSKTINNLS